MKDSDLNIAAATKSQLLNSPFTVVLHVTAIVSDSYSLYGLSDTNQRESQIANNQKPA